ncbi:cation-translocating P-type ATPase [Ktedonospora formicarum]|uniref:Haloacid dehalogenase n=1 Tax=Ktedonospora formicarum TaxID=2778364 RepID=A0A8J3I4T3_9CHLR|nr:cation-translocating P-type ATPase [Ktedonospora formicarum]GHO48711.1 haloacid dehalogenase [Ktedonospora formicarum]
MIAKTFQDAQNAYTAYRLPTTTVVTAFESDLKKGLCTEEAHIRLRYYGKNALPSPPSKPLWRQILAQFWTPLTILLLIAILISLLVWWIEHETPFPYESLTIFVIVLFNGILGFLQEYRADKAMVALQAMEAITAQVLRDGEIQVVATAQIVPGDILLIEEGDIIAADARVLEAIALRLIEGALTGESVPVSKHTAPIGQKVSIGDQRNMVFCGTAVAAGRGRALVTETGTRTQIGQIAGSLQRRVEKKTPLQKELDRVGKWLGLLVMGIAIMMSLVILLVDRIGTLRELVAILLLVVSLAVAAVPEGLTAITTIVLSLGMQRMAQRNAIVRTASAVEALGATTVICTDKTGTLTKNEMTVRTVVTPSGRVDFTNVGYDPGGHAVQAGQPLNDPILLGEVTAALRAAILANNAVLRSDNGLWTIQGDPTEGALLVTAQTMGLQKSSLEDCFQRLTEIPFSSERKLMSTVHKDRGGIDSEQKVLYSKGAPDVLLARCTSEQIGSEHGGTCMRPLTAERRHAIRAVFEELAADALRTIGMAWRVIPEETSPALEQMSEHLEQELIWLGVVGMIDPPRPEAAMSIKQAQQSGVRVIMITGDHPITARAIAYELGVMQQGEHVVTGLELEQTSDDRLKEMVRDVAVYARVAPHHKLRIVQALKANGEITAMTGDGVNDAPALQQADIGVAMGRAGTDVARGAADMILLDDNFVSIVAAIEEGRAIYANLQKCLRYLLSSNIGEVLTMFFGVILASTIGLIGEAGTAIVAPLLATQILWINLLTDAGPALSLGVDPPDPRQMHRPPRSQRHPLISRSMWVSISIIGVIMTIGTLFILDMSLPGGLIPGNGNLRFAQTMTFTTLVLAQLFNIFNARSDTLSVFHTLLANRWVWLAILLSLLLQGAVVYLPFLGNAFHTVPLHPFDWLLSLTVASTVLWGQEMAKWGRHLLKGKNMVK